MVPTATLIGCLFTLFVSLLLPLGLLPAYARKCPKQGIVSAWFLGAAGFFVPQILVRLPILNALSGASWYLTAYQTHPMLLVFGLAFTAGLFELAGRFAVALCMKRKLTYRRALAAGLGHGGIEAILIVGLAYISNLVCISMINSGTLVSAMAPGLPEAAAAQLAAVQDSLLHTSPALFFLSGVERLLTMTIQAALSMLICYGVFAGCSGKMALACLGLHTLVDLTAGVSVLIGTRLTQTTAYGIIYLILFLTAGLSLWILKTLREHWHRKENDHERI